MWSRLTRSILGVALGALPLAARAQAPGITPLSQGTGSSAPATPALGGLPTIDVIRLSGNSPSIPLRYGGVVANSEVVYLDGVPLIPSVDYQFDPAGGVLYLARSVSPGQMLRVSYRHLQSAPAAASSSGGLGTFSLALAPGALNFRAGFGMAERLADGNVLTSNIYGWNNSFALGQTKLSGVFLLGQRERVDARSGFEVAGKPGQADTGASQFLLQELATKFNGGTIQASFQDISKNFTGFGAVQDSGVDKAIVDQLAKEKGLTRMGLAMDGVNLGGMKLSESFKQVADGAGSIQWQSYGLTEGGLQLNWNEQKVGHAFSRFGDIAEANRAQLAKEAGITRDDFAGAFAAKFGKLSFDQNSITDTTHQGIFRRTISLDATTFKFNYGDQQVTSQFSRFGSLSDPQSAQWARERGLNREWMSLDYAAFGAKNAPLHFDESVLTGQGGSFMSTDVSATMGRWSIDHRDIGASNGAAALAALAPTEVASAVQSVAGMYAQGPAKPNPADNSLFLLGGTLDRDFTRIQGEPAKNWKLTLDSLDLKGAVDGGRVDDIQLVGKQLTASYRDERLGRSFSEISEMMGFEKAQLGQLPGFDRTDFSLAGTLGGKKAFSFSDTRESTGSTEAGLDRTTLSYADKGISLTAGMRNEGAQFAVGPLLGDSENGLLSTLQGFNEKDFHLMWEVRSNLKLDTSYSDAKNGLLGQDKYSQNTIIAWNPDKNTAVNFVDQAQKSDDPLSLLFANSVERLSLSRNLGRYGILQYMQEDIGYNGTLASTPGSHKEYVSYEAKLSQSTSVKTEETRTSFDDGTKENINANTLSTQLTKKVGVSVSEVDIDRAGVAQDEKKQNYGMWWDIGNGLRFSYGCARQLVGATDTQLQTMGLSASPGVAPVAPGTPAKIGDIGVGSASYSLTDTNSIATQVTNNVQLSTLKPFRFGMFSDVKMSFSYDALDNQSSWVKENQFFGFNGKLGANTLGAEYKSQMVPGGAKGIDRTFGWSTDQNEKLPLRASMQYKLRTMPTGQDVTIRNYSLLARPFKGVEVTNQLSTNPEVANGNAVLGSIVQATRANRWKLDYKGNADTIVGGSWEELINDQTRLTSRTGGLNLTLRAKSGSPITLFYGLEDSNPSIGVRQQAYRYHIQFDQKPGPNQTFSFFVGNVSYEGMPAVGFQKDNWSMRLDYQLRF